MLRNKDNETKNSRRSIYAAALFLTLNSSLISYTNSSFLSTLVGEKLVGALYIVSSLITIGSFLVLPRILARADLRRLLIILSAVTAGATLLLGLLSSPLALILALFIFFYTTGALARYGLDLYLEGASSNKLTGGIRGIFLTIINLAWLCSPLISGWLLDGSNNYPIVYLGAAAASLPLLALLVFSFRPLPPPQTEAPALARPLFILVRPRTNFERDIKNAIAVDFILNFFYALMVVYTPIYLHQYIGFDWDQIGIIFTIMLLPFVLLDYPLGWLSDRWLGEKEIMVAGLAVMSFAAMALSFITSGSIVLWAGLLFLSRVGAASVEVAKETYLFKRIGPGDTSVLSLSRMMVSFSYIIGPAAAMAFLAVFDFRFIFAALGLVVLFGLRFALALVDTK